MNVSDLLQIHNLLDQGSLHYRELPDAKVAIPFEDETVVFVASPAPGLTAFLLPFEIEAGWGQEVAAELLRATHATDYVKVVSFAPGELALAIELPTEILDPRITEGLARSLARLDSGLAPADLVVWKEDLASALVIDGFRQLAAIGSQGIEAGYELRPAPSGSLLIAARVDGQELRLRARFTGAAISLEVGFHLGPPEEQLIELNTRAPVLKASLDDEESVLVRYQVPIVTEDALETAIGLLAPLAIDGQGTPA